MAKKIIIVHGWDSHPNDAWLPWLKKQLEQRGHEVIVPAMPHPDTPTIDDWVSYLAQAAQNVNQDTAFVGHSIGCQTILRYLEQLPKNTKVGPVILVAPWFTLQNFETNEEKEVAKPWLETPLNFVKMKTHLSKIVCLFSDNDPYVALGGNKKIATDNLAAEIIIKHNLGHFAQVDKVTELPDVLRVLED